MEAIKHIFPIKGACFVLAVDRVQLEKSVKQLYGDIDFENYYRRFISREANLPEAVTCNLDGFIQHLFNEYFNEKAMQGIIFPFSGNQQRDVFEYSRTICRAFRFTPRQMKNLFRIYSQFLAVHDNRTVNNYMLSWFQAYLLMIAFSISNKDIYTKIGNNNISIKEFSDFINNLNYVEGDERKILWIALAFHLNDSEVRQYEIHEYFNDKLKIGKTAQETTNALAKSVDNYLHSTTTFQSLYKNLEEWRSFIE